MSRLSAFSVILFSLFTVPLTVHAALHHELQVSVEAGLKEVMVVDTIELPFNSSGSYEFLLNHAFVIDKVEGGKVTERPRLPPRHETAAITHGFQREQLLPQPQFESGPGSSGGDGVLRYEDYPEGMTIYRLDAQQPRLTLRYRARISHLGSDNPGIVLAYPQDERSPDGIFLDPSAAWYPLLSSGGESGLSFTMEVTVPEQWSAISQGTRASESAAGGRKRVVWEESKPQQGIFLIAGRYVSYAEKTRGYEAQVFLRQADDRLANDYLALTRDYIALYERLLGAYPYTKFALVESFWESGFGMPSFTFIGPAVIRLPFIRTTSYPHEILHNWWGNSVYVDYSSGNWSEGLTSYLADYLLDEQRGNGANHRREALQKYTDFIRGDNDFALNQFTSSTETPGQAVGYGKSLMLYHMLRRKMGDEKFLEALRLFYQQYRFKTASYVDLARVFSEVHGKSLDEFFSQWVRRAGAPELAVTGLQRKQADKGWRVEGVLKQVQLGMPYRLDVPVAVTLEGEQTARLFSVDMTGKQQSFSFDLPAKPLRIDVDPEFDLFRRLSVEETPPALSQSFGAERMLLVMADRASAELKTAWRKLARDWGMEIRSDGDLKHLPADSAVWLLGWDNRLLDEMRDGLGAYGAKVSSMGVTVEGKEYHAGRDSVVMALHNPAQPQHSVVWFAATAADAISRYGQRLPHYRKYSFLAFDRQHNNVLKGQWPVLSSPLGITLEPGVNVAAVWPARPPLAPQ